MIAVGVKTDSPITELRLLAADGSEYVISIETGRELALRLLGLIHDFLEENGESFESINGLVCFEGPGSFTGLRIGHTVMNTLAYSKSLSITQKSGSTWFSDGVAELKAGENKRIVIPEYGSEANITAPKK